MKFANGVLIVLCLCISRFVGAEVAPEEDDDKAALEIIKDDFKTVESKTVESKAAESKADALTASPSAVSTSTVPVKAGEATTKETRPEDEIPVLSQPVVAPNHERDVSGRLALSLGVIVTVLGGAFVFSRFYSKRRFGVKPHHQIKVLTQFALGPKKNLAIVRVAGESILIGITDHNISLIKTLSLLDEELPTEVPENFSQELGQADQAGHVVTAGPAFTMKISEKVDGEDFAFGGIKEMVSKRLREMRSL